MSCRKVLTAIALLLASACSNTRTHHDTTPAIIQARLPASIPGAHLQHQSLLNWVDQKEDLEIESKSLALNFPAPVDSKNLSIAPNASWELIRRTSELYFQNVGRNSLKSFVWQQIPFSANLVNKLTRQKLIRDLQKLGITNIRLALPIQSLKRNTDGNLNEIQLQTFDEILNAFISPCDEDASASTGCESFKINLELTEYEPDEVSAKDDRWTKDYAKLCLELYLRFQSKIKAVTLKSGPQSIGKKSYEIEHLINVGKAAILARLLIEKEIAKTGNERLLFFLPTSFDRDRSTPDYSIIADFILAQPWVVSSKLAELGKRDPQMGGFVIDPMTGQPERPSKGVDFDSLKNRWAQVKTQNLSPLDWSIAKAVFDDRPTLSANQKYDEIIMHLNELRELHMRFKRETQETMSTYTILELQGDDRVRLFERGLKQWSRYSLPLVFLSKDNARRIQDTIDAASLARSGIPILSFTHEQSPNEGSFANFLSELMRGFSRD